MGIFNLFKKPAAAPVETILVMQHKQSAGFKGFKRIRLTTYGDEIAQGNIKLLIDQDISEVTLTVKVDNNNFTEPTRFLDVAADGLHVGTHYPHGDNKNIDLILSGAVDQVHVRLEDAGDKYIGTLFVHIK